MAKELSITEKRELAKMLYLVNRLTQVEIAQRLGVSKQSVNKWVKDGDWEALRTSISITREDQLGNLYRQIAEINKAITSRAEGERFATSKEADTINKIAAAIEKMEKDVGIADIISVSKGFLEWLRKTDPEKTKELSYYFDSYIKDKIR